MHAEFFSQGLIMCSKERNLPNCFVLCRDCWRYTELNALTKHCSAKCYKYVKVSNGQWQWAGCIMVDVCMKFQ